MSVSAPGSAPFYEAGVAGTGPSVGLDIRGGGLGVHPAASQASAASAGASSAHGGPYPQPRPHRSRSRSHSRSRSRSRSRSQNQRDREQAWELERERERERHMEQRYRNRDTLANRQYIHQPQQQQPPPDIDTDPSPCSHAPHRHRAKRGQGFGFGFGVGAGGGGRGGLTGVVRARFLFPFCLGLLLGILAMCAFIVIQPSLSGTLLCQLPPAQDTNTNTNTNADPHLHPQLPMGANSLPLHQAQSAPVSVSVSGGCHCPACPPPVCSSAAAGSGGCHKGMPRFSRWMRDTFLGHMVNFTHEWLQKPDQLIHQLNYLISPDGNFDNVQKLAFLDPFIDGVTDPGLSSAKWLTVADGYFGMEGAYVHHRARELRRKYSSAHPSAKALPNIHVTGTALSNMTLRYAFKLGFVDAISEENVEDLSFPDERFDYVLIKEAFHHLTRPYLGLYELIRVCRHGVILIEPTEIAGRPSSYWSSVPPMARSLVIPDVQLGFESDLIQFRLSVHELQKVAMALNLPAVAVKGLNNPLGSRGNRTRYFSDLDNLNSLGLAGKRPFNLVAAVVFKQPPSNELKHEMIKQHFLFLDVVYTPFPYDDWELYPNL